MPIQIACPSCAKQLRVPENLLGKAVRCPNCKNTFTAEMPSEEEPETPSETRQESNEGLQTSPSMAKRRGEEEEDELEEEPAEDEDHPRRRKRRRVREDERPGRKRAHRGGIVMALGIISLVMSLIGAVGILCCGALGLLLFGVAGTATGLPAWLLGQFDLKAMRNREMDFSGEGMTKAGWICGIIGTVLGILEILCGGVLLIVAVGMVASGKVK